MSAQYGPVGVRTIETYDETTYRVLAFQEDVLEGEILFAIEEDRAHIRECDREEELGGICMYDALVSAARYGRDDLVRLFLRLGADPSLSVPEDEGYTDYSCRPLTTPLSAALAAGHLGTAQILRDHGATA